MSHRRFVVLSSPCLRGCLQTWSGQWVVLATSTKRSGLDLQWFCVQQEMIQKGRKWPLQLCRFWCTVWLALWKCFAQLHRTFSIPKLVGYVGMCIEKRSLPPFHLNKVESLMLGIPEEGLLWAHLTWNQWEVIDIIPCSTCSLDVSYTYFICCLSRPCYRSGGSPVSLHRFMLGA